MVTRTVTTDEVIALSDKYVMRTYKRLPIVFARGEGCRLWDADTNKKLDKDRFRRDMGGVEEVYQEVLSRISTKQD